jgi:hypothetical protein
VREQKTRVDEIHLLRLCEGGDVGVPELDPRGLFGGGRAGETQLHVVDVDPEHPTGRADPPAELKLTSPLPHPTSGSASPPSNPRRRTAEMPRRGGPAKDPEAVEPLRRRE